MEQYIQLAAEKVAAAHQEWLLNTLRTYASPALVGELTAEFLAENQIGLEQEACVNSDEFVTQHGKRIGRSFRPSHAVSLVAVAPPAA